MSDIALYNLLKRIPDATDDEVERVVADVASSKDVATKADSKAEILKIERAIAEVKTEIAKLETRLTWKLLAIAAVMVAVIKYL